MLIKRVRLAAVTLAVCAMALLPRLGVADDIAIDCNIHHQVIHGFGSAFVGNMDAYRDPAMRQQYATDLGANIIRYAIEARVCKEVASVDEIKYQDFDWGRNDELESIAETVRLNPGEVIVIGSVWTPPHWMKEGDQLRWGDESCGGRLREDKIPFFARFMAQYLLGVKAKFGIELYAVSIQNELLFSEPYKSCAYTPELYVKTVMAVGAELEKAGIKTRIMGPEDMTAWPDRDVPFIKPLMDDPKGRQYLDFFCSHGYSDGVTSEGSENVNSAFWDSVKQYGKELWMTETSGESTSWLGSNGKPGAITLATKIHNGLVYGNVSGWVYWGTSDKPATDSSLYDNLIPTKKYYASKQFYRYIRPGAVRVDAAPDGTNNLNVSAFSNAKGGTLTVVLINRAGAANSVNLSIKGAPPFKGLEVYRSSETEDCLRLPDVPETDGKVVVEIPAQSIVTLYGDAMSPLVQAAQEMKAGLARVSAESDKAIAAETPGTLLVPSAFADEDSIDRGLARLQRIRAISEKHHNQAHALLESYGARADAAASDEATKQAVHQIVDTTKDHAFELNEGLATLVDAIWTDVEGVYKLMKSQQGAYKIEDQKIIFQSDKASAQYNGLTQNIRDTAAKMPETQKAFSQWQEQQVHDFEKLDPR